MENVAGVKVRFLCLESLGTSTVREGNEQQWGTYLRVPTPGPYVLSLSSHLS